MSASITGPPLCTQPIVGSAVVTIIPAPVASFTYATPFCVTGVDPFPTFTGGGVAGVFSSTAGLVFVSTTTGQIDLSAVLLEPILLQIPLQQQVDALP